MSPASSSSSTASSSTAPPPKDWIRGVNIGGWLVLERFITPYAFAITTCHIAGDLCYYPGQIDAPPGDHDQYCDLFQCQPVRTESVTGQLDYPVDEYRLTEAFGNETRQKENAKRWLDSHYEHFVTRTDVETLHAHGVTHVRVPLGHWILGNIAPDEPYVQANGWLYFVRFVSWCREFGIQVWPDLHTAPGSQNGFDNSGQLLAGNATCVNWSDSEANVARTLDILTSIATQIKADGLDDVVTGLGILNEPFVDCNVTVVRQYNNDALDAVREILGPSTNIYIGDLFNATKWNDGWWQGEESSSATTDDRDVAQVDVSDVAKYENTFLDSHYYHVFAAEPRGLSPRQHIAYVCRHNHRDTVGCCYEDHEGAVNTIPSKTISRIVGEWSASFDTLVVAKLDTVMEEIAINGTALEIDRQISPLRQAFLRHFVEAQMVTYEAKETGGASWGWFFWTLKTEGGAFAEWDFLRGLEEGWIPSIPPPHVSSEELYGTCEDIIFKVRDDSMTIIHEFPEATFDPDNWQGVVIDDDLVVSHGESLKEGWTSDDGVADESIFPVEKSIIAASNATVDTVKGSTAMAAIASAADKNENSKHAGGSSIMFPVIAVCFFAYAIKLVFFRKRNDYTSISTSPNAMSLTV